MSQQLYHITTRAAAQAGQHEGHYRHASLVTEGFIHCSTLEQLLVPANERFRHQHGLVLLVIDSKAVSADLVFEDSYGSGIEFPHIYDTVNWSAVIGVVDFPCRDDGQFSVPECLPLSNG